MNATATHHPALEQLQRRALRVGLAGSALCAAGATLNLEQFLQSYLLGYLFWIGIVLGSFWISRFFGMSCSGDPEA